MKNEINKLAEMLWEFTLQCNKNCQYCGSKSLLNKDDEHKINRKEIAEQIAKAKPDELNITGGEPSVLMDELIECVKICNKSGVKCKILTNGNLFFENKFSALDKMVECYGYSVNTEEDIQNSYKNMEKIPFDKTTMITNFGIHNLKLFEKLWKFAVNFKYWQIQLTIGNELQLDIEEIKDLFDNINGTPDKPVKIIIADNMNCSACRAGISGCAVTWNGDVVPCLSYRAWSQNMNVQGNVFKDGTLNEIWENRFKFYRSRKFFPCCKDISGIKEIARDEIVDKNLSENNLKLAEKILTDKKNKKYPQVYVYGVVNPNDDKFGPTIVYGVT